MKGCSTSHGVGSRKVNACCICESQCGLPGSGEWRPLTRFKSCFTSWEDFWFGLGFGVCVCDVVMGDTHMPQHSSGHQGTILGGLFSPSTSMRQSFSCCLLRCGDTGRVDSPKWSSDSDPALITNLFGSSIGSLVCFWQRTFFVVLWPLLDCSTRLFSLLL